MSETKLGAREAFSVVFVPITAKLFCAYLPMAVKNAGGAAWYSFLPSAAAAYLVFRLAASTARCDLFGSFEAAFGRKIGRIFQILFAVYFFFYTVFSLNENIKIIKTYNFPTTDARIFAAVSIITAVFVCSDGIVGAVRLSEFYIKLILFTFAAIFVLSASQYDFTKLFPILGNGVDILAKESVVNISVFSDVLILLVLMRDCGGKERTIKYGRAALVFSCITVMLSVLFYSSVFDFGVSADKASGLLELVKNIYRGKILQRVGSMFFLMMSVIFSISFCVLFGTSIRLVCCAFNLRRRRKAMLLTAALMFITGSLLPIEARLSAFLRFGGVCAVFVVLISALKLRFGRKRMTKATALVLCLFMLCGCSDMREVSDEAYAIVLAVDRGDKTNVRLTAAIPSYDSSDETKNDICTVEARNVSEGLNKLNLMLARKVSLIHLKAVIFSEEISRRGLFEYALPIQRHIDVQNAMGVLISEGDASDKLKLICKNGSGNISKEVELLLLSKRYNAFYPVVMFDSFCDDMTSIYKSPMCAYGKKGEAISGLALFDGDKMTGTLSEDEACYFMLAKGGSIGSILNFSQGESAEITGNKSKISVKEGNIHVKISASARCDDGEKTLYELQNSAEDEIKSKAEAVLRKTLRCGCDALGFRGRAAKNYLTIEKWQNYTPKEDDISVDVSLTLGRN